MNEIEISFKDLWALFVRRFKWIALIAAVSVIIAVLITTLLIQPMYVSTVTVLATTYGDRSNTSITYNEIMASQNLTNSYTSLITSNRMLAQVAEAMNNEYTVGQLKGMVSATSIKDTQIIVIEIESPSAELSARVGNSLAAILPGEVASWEIGGKVVVIDYAMPAGGPSSPNLVLNILIALIVGLGVGFAAFLIYEKMDTVLHDDTQLANLFEMPVLGIIPPLDSPSTTGSYGSYVYGATKGGNAK